jgi:hypothetical protein
MKYSILLSIFLFSLLGFENNTIFAQTITPSTFGVVETCTNQTYTASGFTMPQGATFDNYMWNVAFNAQSNNSPFAPSCGGTINGVAQSAFTSTNIHSNSINVVWGDFFAPMVGTVTCTFNYTESNGSKGSKSKTVDVNVLGVCSQMTLTGPNAIQRCCTNAVNYSISN